jgi:hypothetical protein
MNILFPREATRAEGMSTKRKLLPEKVVTALYRKDYTTLQRLVNRDNVNLPDEDGSTLLMLATAASEPDPALLKFLIDRGADVNLSRDRGRYTALHLAAQDVQKDNLRVLLEAGADANAQDANGWTPLHHVVRAPDPRLLLVMALLDHGADPAPKDGPNPSLIEETRGTDIGRLLQNAVAEKSDKPRGKSRLPFMEHPSGKDSRTAVEAMAEAITRLRALPQWDDWITFSAQGMGGRLDSYHFAALRMRKEEIEPEEPLAIDLDLVARRAQVPRAYLAKVGKRTYSVGRATPKQTARVLDTIFRRYLGIRPHTGEGNDYAVGAEW